MKKKNLLQTVLGAAGIALLSGNTFAQLPGNLDSMFGNSSGFEFADHIANTGEVLDDLKNKFITNISHDLNDRWNHIPIIVLSAKGQLESKVELYDLGVDNYLVKPFDIEELEAVVNATCEQRRRLSQLFQHNYLVAQDSVNSFNSMDPEHIEKNDLVEKTVAYVLENLDDAELNVTSIGKALNVGRNKLQKEIKEATSLTPVEFLRSIRLSEAKKLLEDPERQVSEVAYMVGFNNLSYFSRAFKNEYGFLPSEWQVQDGE